MARKKSRSIRSSSGRDIVTSIANRPVLLPRRSYNQVLLDLARLTQQDGRAYIPSRSFRPARHVSGRIASTSYKKYQPLSVARPYFDLPQSVTVCVRRSQRREVLFARGRGGRNGQRRSRRNFYSKVKC